MVTQQKIYLALAIFAPLLSALPVAMLGRRLGRRVACVALFFPVLSTISVLGLASQLSGGQPFTVEWPWVPSLGLNLTFLVDGLSVFFALVVSGMGALIFFYAGHYLDDHYEHHGRFYCYLLLFMAAMLGTVFANHLVLLFIFWELTGLASFLLIGFNHTDEVSRRGARMAFLVTGSTGLLLMAGAILLGQGAGTFQLNELLAQRGEMAGKEWLNIAFLLVALGAFGKSAQFPFHFWLPNAMAAPTPVSAYLHSATMVKLGVFLIARVLPIFQASDWWMPLLAGIGFTTMLLGAILALLSHDLKAVLAYSTVSMLGFLIGNYGLTTSAGATSDLFHIFSHVLFKGSLFMVAGIIDHSTGTRDLRKLGGLWQHMPLLGFTCLAAAASMAGIMGTFGFVSKELMLKELLVAAPKIGMLGWFCFVAATVASLLKVTFSLRLFIGSFLGSEPPALRAHFHQPSLAFQLPPLLLSLGALVFGVAPMLLDRPFEIFKVAGLHTSEPFHLVVWHGFNRELGLSTLIVLLGVAFFLTGRRVNWRWARIPEVLRFDTAFDGLVDGFAKATKGITKATGADSPTLFLPIVLGFLVISMGGYLMTHLPLGEWIRLLKVSWTGEPWNIIRVLTGLAIALGALGAIWLKRWPAQLISVGASGFLVCFYFVLYRAPDLALTQILVETVTLILVLYLLGRFPASAQEGEDLERRKLGTNWMACIIAVGVGLLMAGLSFLAMAGGPVNRMGEFFLTNTLPKAEGSNAVNTILVDFRGFDTLGEITVLVIAMLGVIGLVMRYRRAPDEPRRAATIPDETVQRSNRGGRR